MVPTMTRILPALVLLLSSPLLVRAFFPHSFHPKTIRAFPAPVVSRSTPCSGNHLFRPVFMSSSNGEDDTSEDEDAKGNETPTEGMIEMVEDQAEKEEKKIANRRKRVALGYRAMAGGHLSLLLAAPLPITLNTLQAAQSPLTVFVVSWILAGAAEADRLGSDTYKRLNLGLIMHSSTSVAMMGLQSARFRISPWLGIFTVVSLVNSVKGYGFGVLGMDKKGDTSIVSDLVSGVKSTTKGLFSFKNAKASGYLFSTYFMLYLVGYLDLRLFQALKAPVTSTFPLGAKKLAIARRLSALKQFKLMAIITYTLKDAADRKRMEGSTFVQLGYLLATCFGIFAVLAMPKLKWNLFGVICGVNALWAFYNSALSFVLKRQGAEKKAD